MIFNYLRTMLRRFKRDLKYAFINISGLVVGLACFILLALYLETEFSYDRHYQNHENIFRLVQERTTDGQTNLVARSSWIVPPILAETYPEVKDYVRFRPSGAAGGAIARYGDKALHWDNLYLAEQNVFQVFSTNILYGDGENGLVDPNNIAISESVSKAYFGDANPIGEVLELDTGNFTVSVVYADQPDNTHMKYPMLLSFNRMLPYLERDDVSVANVSWSSNDYVYLVMEDGYRAEDFSRISQEFYNKYMSEVGNELNSSMRFVLEPLADIHLHSQAQRDHPKGNTVYLYTFLAIGLMVLLIAVINYVNLATVRSAHLAKEIGMRKVIGAHKTQLIKQFMLESFVFVVIAVALATACVMFILAFTPIETLLGTEVHFNLVARPALLLALGLLTLVIGVLAGAYPAFFLASISPIGIFRSNKGAGIAALVRQGLVFTQFTISIGVIIATLLMSAQLNYMQNRPLGFLPDNLLIVPLRGADVIEKISTIKTDLNLDDRIIEVAQAPTVPGQNVQSWSGRLETGQGVQQRVDMGLIYVDEGYLSAFDIALNQGRELTPRLDDPHQALVNETLVKKMGWTDPIGKQITYPDQPDHIDTVIGVVDDFHFESLHQPIEPVALFLGVTDTSQMNQLNRSMLVSNLAIRFKEGAGASILSMLQEKFRAYDPKHPFEYRFMNDILADLYVSEQRQNIIIGIFAGISIFISCLGLYGLSAFNAARRAKEMSIRRVLSASPLHILLLLFKNTLGLILASSVFAIMASYLLLNSWLNGFAYRESLGGNWYIFILSAVVAVIIAFATVVLQSYKTVYSNPAKNLRTE